MRTTAARREESPSFAEDVRERRIAEYLALSASLARRFARRGEPLEDLEQVAALALVKAADRFDPSQNVAFGAYATRSILGELKRHFRDKGWAVRPPRRIQELCLELNREIESQTHSRGRAPTVPELARALEATEEDVIEALEASESYWLASLDAPSPDGDPLGARLGDGDPELLAAEQRVALDPLLEALAPRERRIVRLRFVDGLTQSEIAARLGLSQMHVSRLLRTSLETLRATGRESLGDVTDLIE